MTIKIPRNILRDALTQAAVRINQDPTNRVAIVKEALHVTRKYFRSTGNLADNMHEMGIDDLAQSFDLSTKAAQLVHQVINDQDPKSPLCTFLNEQT